MDTRGWAWASSQGRRARGGWGGGRLTTRTPLLTSCSAQSGLERNARAPKGESRSPPSPSRPDPSSPLPGYQGAEGLWQGLPLPDSQAPQVELHFQLALDRETGTSERGGGERGGREGRERVRERREGGKEREEGEKGREIPTLCLLGSGERATRRLQATLELASKVPLGGSGHRSAHACKAPGSIPEHCLV